MSEEQKYQIFDADDREFTPVVTSNANIRSVCEVLTKCSFKSHQERVYYAQIGDITPSTEKDGTRVYEFTNVYDSKASAAAVIAQRLFYDFPEVVTVEDSTAKIKDKELSDKLIRSEVWRAFEDWLGKFGENPFEVSSFLNTLATNPTLTNIVQAMSGLQAAGSGSSNTAETINDGSENFSPETDTGKK